MMRRLLFVLGAAVSLPVDAQLTAPLKSGDTTITVTGTRTRESRVEMSDWRMAETPHVVVFSQNDEEELRDTTHNLEKLHFLLSALLGRVRSPTSSTAAIYPERGGPGRHFTPGGSSIFSISPTSGSRGCTAGLIRGRLELGARIEVPVADGGEGAAALDRRSAWLDRLRGNARQFPNLIEHQLLLAEAECRSGHPQECLEAAERAIAQSPADTTALVWKGTALVCPRSFILRPPRPVHG